MSLAARVAASEQWKGQGDRSAAERLAKEAGTTKRAAEDALKTQKARDGSPELDGAVRRGDVSPEQARAIGEATDADPEAAGPLLELVGQGASLGELRDEAERRRAAAAPDSGTERRRAHRNRACRTWKRGEQFFLNLQTTLEHGARILAHLDLETDHVFNAARGAGVRESFDNYRADAATNLLTNTTAAPAQEGGPPAEGGPTRTRGRSPSAARGSAPKRRSGPPRRSEPSGRLTAHLHAHLHAQPGELLAAGEAGPRPGTGRRPAKARSSLHAWEEGLQPAEGGQASSGREPERSEGSRAETNDHRTPYATKQETALGNLDRACTWHHYLITHRGYRFEPGTGRRRLLSPQQQQDRQQEAS
jgi:hypothetical protein